MLTFIIADINTPFQTQGHHCTPEVKLSVIRIATCQYSDEEKQQLLNAALQRMLDTRCSNEQGINKGWTREQIIISQSSPMSPKDSRLVCFCCNNSFTRMDSLHRHQAMYCKATDPRQQRKDYNDNDMIAVICKMLQKHRRQWRKDLNKFQNHVRMTTMGSNCQSSGTCNDEDTSENDHMCVFTPSVTM